MRKTAERKRPRGLGFTLKAKPESVGAGFAVTVRSSKYLMEDFYEEKEGSEFLASRPSKRIKFFRDGFISTEKLTLPVHFDLIPGKRYMLQIQFTEIPDEKSAI